MSRTLGNTVDILLERVRQSGSLAVTPDFGMQIFTTCQQIANILLQRIITSETLTTKKQKLVYSISADLTSAAQVLSITESNRELTQCQKLSDISAYENNWFRNITGTRFEAWASIGRDFFVIYPAKAANSSVVVEHIKALTVYTNYAAASATNCELPDEDVEVALKLAELVLLLRARNLSQIKATTNQLIDILKAKNVLIKSPDNNPV